MTVNMLLVVNAGSSSLKVTIYTDDTSDVALASAAVEDITSERARLITHVHEDGQEPETKPAPSQSHSEAAQHIYEWLQASPVIGSPITAVGYRIVHGGAVYTQPTRITDAVIEQLHELTSLAPNHMAATIQCMTIFRTAYPEATHIGCFDTSFFADIPRVAQTLPLPKDLRQEGIRRYGFHGLSYTYLLTSFRHHEGEVAAHGRVILAHLGSGASVAACKDGRPVDMSMGYTPVSGVPMATRTGDVEPGVLLYLQQYRGMTVEEVYTLVTKQSGLLGISGKTADMYELLQQQDTDADVALAVEYFCYKIRQVIGGYAATLGGVDSIIFTGGIAERSAEIRARILAGLDFLGVRLDPARNERGDRLLSSDESTVGVHVIPAREDHTIIMQVKEVIRNQS